MLVIIQSRLQMLFLWLRKQHPWQFLVWGGLAWLWQYIQIPYRFDLQDDFFLWYGVQRFAAGDVPILDFQSYDAGRYIVTYILSFGNDTLYSVRFAQVFLGACIVSAGVWFIQRNKNVHIGVLALTAIVLIVWLFPRHKFYDIAISVVNVLYLWYLLQYNTRRARLLAAPMVMVSLLVNRNHAVYLVFGLLLWIIWQHVSCPSEQKMQWQQYKELFFGIGIALIMLVFGVLLVPGYIEAYYYFNVLLILQGHYTDLSLQITWPWQIDWFAVTTSVSIRDAIFSWILFLLPCVGICALILEARFTHRTGTVRPYLLAPALMILPYTIHVYAYADVSHLAQSIYPLILYIAAVVSQILSIVIAHYRRLVWFVFVGWVVASSFVIYPRQPIIACADRCVPVSIESNVFFTDAGTREDYLILQEWLEKYSATQSFVIYPLRPGLYALNRAVAPVYETYAIYPLINVQQTRDIASIEHNKVRMIIIGKKGVRGLKETAFRNTNPLTFAHIRQKYTVVESTEYYEAYLRNP
jgi:hypothetical protein